MNAATRDYRFAIAAKLLRGRHFIIGGAFTVFDAYLFVMFMWAGELASTVRERRQTYADHLETRRAVPCVSRSDLG